MVAGSAYEKVRADKARWQKEMRATLDEWFKRLDSDRPLSGKETVQLQKLLSRLKMSLKE